MVNLFYFIIVPIYNAEKFLDKCLLSITSQTYNNFCVIAVDDGSTDNSGNIIDDYSKKFDCIKVIHQNNKGVFLARKAGLEMAVEIAKKTNVDFDNFYVLYCDPDDWLENDALLICNNHLKNEKYDILMFTFKQIKENSTQEIFCNHEYKLITNKDELIALGLKIQYGYVTTKCHKLSLIDFNIFSVPYRIDFHEDTLESYSVFSKANSCLLIPNTLYNYFRHNDSVTKKSFYEYIKDKQIDAFFYPYMFMYNEINKLKRNKLRAFKSFLYNQATDLVYHYISALKETDKYKQNYLLDIFSHSKYVSIIYKHNKFTHFPLKQLLKQKKKMGKIAIFLWKCFLKMKLIKENK